MSKENIIIFGNGNLAKLAHYYFTIDSTYKVVGFTVDKIYKNSDNFLGLPLVSFEEIMIKYPPKFFKIFIAIGYSKMNEIRKIKYEEFKSMGYELVSYISSKANIAPNVEIGDNCFILENNNVQPFSIIKNNVILWSGNHIGHDSKIGHHCFLASHVVVSGCVEIGNQCFLGVNATIVNNIKIGYKTLVGAGCLIRKNTESNSVYFENESNRSKIPSYKIKI